MRTANAIKTLILSAVIGCMLSSCATIMNQRTQEVIVHADTEVKVVLGKDTTTSENNYLRIYPKRKNESLKITVLNDSVSRNITLNPANSFPYWFNIYATWGLGALVDRSNPKRYDYPAYIDVKMNRAAADSVFGFSAKHLGTKYRNSIKFT